MQVTETKSPDGKLLRREFFVKFADTEEEAKMLLEKLRP